VKSSARKPSFLVLLCAVATIAVAGTTFAAEAVKADAKPDAKKEAAAATYTQDLVDQMDADKNGEVSKKEFMDFMSKEFDRLDVNHDGKLQQSEIVNKPMMGQQKSSVSHR